MGFTAAWLLAAGLLVALYATFGRITGPSFAGVLVDNRQRYSLNHLQIAIWTVLVIATLIAAFVSSGFDVSALEIPQPLLVLMGISVASGVAAAAVKSRKDSDKAHIARGNAKPSQVFLEEEGGSANQAVSITKFQGFIFTLVAATAYVVLALKAQDYPELPEQVLWLVGISQAGYVAGKIPPVA